MIIGFLATFGATFLAALVGSSASISASKFYAQLVKPRWAPPAKVFGPVWTVLYLMMAFSAWLIVRNGGGNTNLLLGTYGVQLAVNALWSWTFFKWKSGIASMVTIIVLWIAIAATVFGFWKVDPWAGALLLPYWAWVTFASVLNATVWRLNPELL